MQKYINQLVADIKAIAADPLPIPEIKEGEVLPFEVENWIHTGPLSTMGKLFDLEKIQFPTEEKLTDSQKEILVDAMLDLWKAYRFAADFPKKLPKTMKYQPMVDCLESEAPLVGANGTFHIEFCDYEHENCPFDAEYCQCKDYPF